MNRLELRGRSPRAPCTAVGALAIGMLVTPACEIQLGSPSTPPTEADRSPTQPWYSTRSESTESPTSLGVTPPLDGTCIPSTPTTSSGLSGDETAPADADGDGSHAGDDCDDQNSSIHPGATERCDGIDHDCDGLIDDQDPDNPPLWFPDSDGDGYGDANPESGSCLQVPGYLYIPAGAPADCDDEDPRFNPGAVETLEQHTDYDCDGTVVVSWSDAEGLAETHVETGWQEGAWIDMEVPPGAVSGADGGVVEISVTFTLPRDAPWFERWDADADTHTGDDIYTRGTPAGPLVTFSPDLVFSNAGASGARVWFTIFPSMSQLVGPWGEGDRPAEELCAWPLRVCQIEAQTGEILTASCVPQVSPPTPTPLSTPNTPGETAIPSTPEGAPVQESCGEKDGALVLEAKLAHFSSYMVLGATTLLEFDPVYNAGEESCANSGSDSCWPVVDVTAGELVRRQWEVQLQGETDRGRPDCLRFKTFTDVPSIVGLERIVEAGDDGNSGAELVHVSDSNGANHYYEIEFQARSNSVASQDLQLIGFWPSSHAECRFEAGGEGEEGGSTVDPLSFCLAEFGDDLNTGVHCQREWLSSLANEVACPAGCPDQSLCYDLDADGIPDPVDCMDLEVHQDPDVLDDDGDGYCEGGELDNCVGSATPGDCDDTESAIHPYAEELCNETDEDCDGDSDEGKVSWLQDADGDGFGDQETMIEACECPYATCVVSPCRIGARGCDLQRFDCDDTYPRQNPDAAEIVGDGIDQDCDGTEICYLDADGDGYSPGTDEEKDTIVSATDLSCDGLFEVGEPGEGPDCNDQNPSAHPGAEEVCNGAAHGCLGVEVSETCSADLDENCNGWVDEDVEIGEATDLARYCYDSDGDGHGSPRITMAKCKDPSEQPQTPTSTPSPWTEICDDCNDLNSSIYPGAPDQDADGVDSDCDGQERCLVDADGDGYADSGGALVLQEYASPGFCVDQGALPQAPPSFGSEEVGPDGCDFCSGEGVVGGPVPADVPTELCDDTALSNPGKEEVCDGIDNDCDGSVDEYCLCHFRIKWENFMVSYCQMGRKACEGGGDLWARWRTEADPPFEPPEEDPNRYQYEFFPVYPGSCPIAVTEGQVYEVDHTMGPGRTVPLGTVVTVQVGGWYIEADKCVGGEGGPDDYGPAGPMTFEFECSAEVESNCPDPWKQEKCASISGVVKNITGSSGETPNPDAPDHMRAESMFRAEWLIQRDAAEEMPEGQL